MGKKMAPFGTTSKIAKVYREAKAAVASGDDKRIALSFRETMSLVDSLSKYDLGPASRGLLEDLAGVWLKTGRRVELPAKRPSKVIVLPGATVGPMSFSSSGMQSMRARWRRRMAERERSSRRIPPHMMLSQPVTLDPSRMRRVRPTVVVSPRAQVGFTKAGMVIGAVISAGIGAFLAPAFGAERKTGAWVGAGSSILFGWMANRKMKAALEQDEDD